MVAQLSNHLALWKPLPGRRFLVLVQRSGCSVQPQQSSANRWDWLRCQKL